MSSSSAVLFVGSRAAERRSAGFDSTLRDAQNLPIDISIVDLSRSGFSMQTVPGCEIGDSISIGIPGVGTRTAWIVRDDFGLMGCSFGTFLTENELARALAREISSLVAFPGAACLASDLNSFEPDITPYSRRTRVVLLIGIGLLSWAAVVSAVSAIY